MHIFYFLISKLNFVVIAIIITLIIVSSTLLSPLLSCYKLSCFILCVSVTRAHFVIGPWADELARK
jgi:hypothetical protein